MAGPIRAATSTLPNALCTPALVQKAHHTCLQLQLPIGLSCNHHVLTKIFGIKEQILLFPLIICPCGYNILCGLFFQFPQIASLVGVAGIALSLPVG
jgi:hypothetical protein